MSPIPAAADVTLVVTPRERFGFAVESLQSVIANTAKPYELVYVDIGMPATTRATIEALAAAQGFTVLRTGGYLAPNEARNVGFERVRTRYVVFLENDVMVEPGWLPKLVECAEETGAAIVMPLMCQGVPSHTTVHCAGGRCAIEEGVADGRSFRRYAERIFDQRRPVAELAPTLARRRTELAELHCTLVRTEVLRRLGPLDEELRGTRDHVDLCLQVQALGLPIMLEPAAIASFVDDAPLALADVAFYVLRWSDEWERRSIEHWRRKWRVELDEGLALRIRNIGWRRRAYMLHPFVARVLPGPWALPRRLAVGALSIVDRGVNAVLSRAHRVLSRRGRPAARA